MTYLFLREDLVLQQSDRDEVLAETSLLRHQIYSEMVRRYVKEEAEEQLDFIIKIAHMSEEEIEILAKADSKVLNN